MFETLSDKVIDLISFGRERILYSINSEMTRTYFEIGKLIVEDEQNGQLRAEYGKSILVQLSEKLQLKFGKGFSVDNLENMRKFYLIYSKKLSEQNSETLSRKFDFQLSWSHYLKLIRIENQDERDFYEIETIENQWSLRELKRQFDSALFQRLSLSRNKDEIKQLAQIGIKIEKPQDSLKDPYILEFLGIKEQDVYSESELESRLIDKLEHFLLELGKGFTFVERQKRITIDEKHFHVDLVFYNRLLHSFVLIDLKIGELKHQDIGQMQMYVNFFDRFVRMEDENKTIGIILCQDKSQALVEITLPENNDQIFASKYQTVLPSKEVLIRLLEEKE